MNEAVYPQWPGPEYDTRQEALIACIAQADPGDEITVHQDGCASRWDLDCSCQPDVIVVEGGRA